MDKFEAPSIKETKNICKENVVGEQDLALQQHFP